LSGIGFWELVLLFVIGLLILGPERLPRVATQIGRWVGKARRTANQLRYQLEREIALADIEERKKKKGQEKPPEDSAPADSGDESASRDESGQTDAGDSQTADTNSEATQTGEAQVEDEKKAG
jgi:sec-independent protein translocase protein TatB